MIDTPHAVTPTDCRNPPDSRAPARIPPPPSPVSPTDQRSTAGYLAAAIVLVIVAIVTGLGGRS